jgi:hypothetical protein
MAKEHSMLVKSDSPQRATLRLAICIIVLFLPGAVHAQSPAGTFEQDIQAIDAQLAALRSEERPCAHVLMMQRILPGSGPQETLVRFQYIEEEDTQRPPLRRQMLVKAEVTGNVAARGFAKTYYFTGGRLLAAFYRPDSSSPCGERRLHFRRDKLVAASLRDAGGDCAERLWKPGARNNAGARNSAMEAAAREALARAKEYMDAFRALLRVQDDME